jgi:prevent-host-death family protein
MKAPGRSKPEPEISQSISFYVKLCNFSGNVSGRKMLAECLESLYRNRQWNSAGTLTENVHTIILTIKKEVDNMKFVNVREFSSSVTKLLRDDVEKGQRIVITKRGKPVGLIIPFKDKIAVAEALLEEADSLLKESGLTEVDVLKTLEKVREKVYA